LAERSVLWSRQSLRANIERMRRLESE